jgi:hypothetical protein
MIIKIKVIKNTNKNLKVVVLPKLALTIKTIMFKHTKVNPIATTSVGISTTHGNQNAW